MRKALGFVVHAWDFVAFTKRLACGDHPVCEVEHASGEYAWSIEPRPQGDIFQTNLLHLLHNSPTLKLSIKFIIPVIHAYSYGVNTSQPSRLAITIAARPCLGQISNF
jgi:hypothetical protein